MSGAMVLQPPLTEVRLYGALGQKFGRSHHLAVGSVREAMQALAVVLPGFADHLIEHSEPGYKVFLGRKGGTPVAENRLEAPVSAREAICVVPVVAGRKSGIGQIILGAALLFVAPLGMLAQLGGSLILGGVIQLVAPQRQVGTSPRPENLPSYNFDGALNTTQVGLPVPLTYGRVITGGAIMSQGIATEDFVPAAAPGTLPTQTLPAEQPLNPFSAGNEFATGEGGS